MFRRIRRGARMFANMWLSSCRSRGPGITGRSNDDADHHSMMMIIIIVKGGWKGAAMRLSKEATAANRARVLDAAARLFREKGVDGIAVAELMKAAGRTHGGVDNHSYCKYAADTGACKS